MLAWKRSRTEERTIPREARRTEIPSSLCSTAAPRVRARAAAKRRRRLPLPSSSPSSLPARFSSRGEALAAARALLRSPPPSPLALLPSLLPSSLAPAFRAPSPRGASKCWCARARGGCVVALPSFTMAEVRKRKRSLLEDLSSERSKLARALGSVDFTTRERGVEVLSRWLAKKPRDLDTELLKLWKGIFYCYWHSDKQPVQVRQTWSDRGAWGERMRRRGDRPGEKGGAGRGAGGEAAARLRVEAARGSRSVVPAKRRARNVRKAPMDT